PSEDSADDKEHFKRGDEHRLRRPSRQQSRRNHEEQQANARPKRGTVLQKPQPAPTRRCSLQIGFNEMQSRVHTFLNLCRNLCRSLCRILCRAKERTEDGGKGSTK